MGMSDWRPKLELYRDLDGCKRFFPMIELQITIVTKHKHYYIPQKVASQARVVNCRIQDDGSEATTMQLFKCTKHWGRLGSVTVSSQPLSLTIGAGKPILSCDTFVEPQLAPNVDDTYGNKTRRHSIKLGQGCRYDYLGEIQGRCGNFLWKHVLPSFWSTLTSQCVNIVPYHLSGPSTHLI